MPRGFVDDRPTFAEMHLRGSSFENRGESADQREAVRAADSILRSATLLREKRYDDTALVPLRLPVIAMSGMTRGILSETRTLRRQLSAEAVVRDLCAAIKRRGDRADSRPMRCRGGAIGLGIARFQCNAFMAPTLSGVTARRVAGGASSSATGSAAKCRGGSGMKGSKRGTRATVEWARPRAATRCAITLLVRTPAHGF